MNLTGFALNNARLTALIAVFLALAGLAAFVTFPSKEDPEVKMEIYDINGKSMIEVRHFLSELHPK